MDEPAGEDPVPVVEARGTVRGLLALTLGLVLLALFAWWRDEPLTAIVVGSLSFGPAVGSALVHRGERVRLEEDALVVESRRGRTAYRWADVLEASWEPAELGGGPVLRVRGGPYDVPGPNAPARVATVLRQLIETGRRSPRLPGE